MGYEVLILPANSEHLKKLLRAKIPVIHQHHEAFRIMFGFNEGRKIFFYYGFETLLFEEKNHKRKKVNEIVSMKGPDEKVIVSVNEDILEQSRKMISYDLWNAPRTNYSGPLMAVVYPFSKEKQIVDTLKRPMSELKKASNSILAALVGLSFFNHADIIKGIKWAQKSRDIIHTSFADHIAYLNYYLWKSRDKEIKSALPIQKQFPHLNSIDTFLNEAKTSAYLKNAATQFEKDLKENKLNRWVVDAYLSLLDISVEAEADERAALYSNHLSFIPEDSMGWYHLYRHHHYKGNLPQKINALKGLISAKPHDYNARLSLALCYLVKNEMKKVQEIFNAIPYDNMRYNADYWFLMGVLKEKNGRKRKALKLYAKAIDMRKYLPIYHLHYGRLLLKTGKVQEGIKVLKWAGLIDATGEIKEVADALLENV